MRGELLSKFVQFSVWLGIYLLYATVWVLFIYKLYFLGYDNHAAGGMMIVAWGSFMMISMPIYTIALIIAAFMDRENYRVYLFNIFMVFLPLIGMMIWG